MKKLIGRLLLDILFLAFIAVKWPLRLVWWTLKALPRLLWWVLKSSFRLLFRSRRREDRPAAALIFRDGADPNSGAPSEESPQSGEPAPTGSVMPCEEDHELRKFCLFNAEGEIYHIDTSAPGPFHGPVWTKILACREGRGTLRARLVKPVPVRSRSFPFPFPFPFVPVPVRSRSRSFPFPFPFPISRQEVK